MSSTRSIGKGMIFVAWILILLALTYLFQGYLDQTNNPNTTPHSQQLADGRNEVTLKRNRYGHYVTTGTINGYYVTFLLDTGATIVSVPEVIADELELRRGSPYEVSTANGVITTHLTYLNEISVGDIRLHNIRASINPHMHGDEVLLGMSFLKQLEFTQRGDTLILREY